MRIGLVGIDGSHAEDFLRHFNAEARHDDIRVTAIWGWQATEERLETLTRLSPAARAAPSLDELIDAVDAVIVGDRHGDLHLPHALPCINAGKPVFVDKPLTCSLADAQALVDAAERAGTPLLSASGLRWQVDTAAVKARLADAKGTTSVLAHGTWYPDSVYGGAIFYAIHTIELMQELLGTEWRDLRLDPDEPQVVRYTTGTFDAALSFQPLAASGSSDFGVSVTSPQMQFEQKIALPDGYMLPVVDRIAQMLRTRRAGMGQEALLAPVRMMAEIDALLRQRD